MLLFYKEVKAMDRGIHVVFICNNMHMFYSYAYTVRRVCHLNQFYAKKGRSGAAVM